MTTREKWLALADMCAKATGPNFALEQAIGLAAGVSTSLAPAYTESLDAIVGLIKTTRPTWGWDCAHDMTFQKAPMANVWWTDSTGLHWGGHRSAASPALALCEAFCLAMAETSQ